MTTIEDTQADAMQPLPDVQYFSPPNLLKMKVGDGRIDPETIAKAEMSVLRLKDDFLEWVRVDLERMEAALARAKHDGAARQTHIETLFAVSHDMKGQGGTFGYPLISRIGHSLCMMLERDGKESDLKIATAHVEAIRGVILRNVAGAGGVIGQEIAKGLEAAASHHTTN